MYSGFRKTEYSLFTFKYIERTYIFKYKNIIITILLNFLDKQSTLFYLFIVL